MMPNTHEWRIGPHSLHFEPPDLLWLTFQGRLSLDEAAHLVALYKELGSKQPFFVLADMKDAELLEPEVGEYISEHMHSGLLLGTVYIGARLAQKGLAKGIVLAAQMEERAEPAALETLHFVATKDEARALVVQLRARMSGTQP
ncbi:hypothetical protein F0U60_44670 [Archangium minus]|uniref:Uncharacterized protein n=1 Tax=Archangium minus TaxID=83450 RepID=A0ABY9X4Y1_9BACT|nr:hypothetical protein F0U61_44925 [Archangium violaceum]WNG50442.1 hypothetical protein F0U60_44670 [Archangium minus]